jgi:hypothetical protein
MSAGTGAAKSNPLGGQRRIGKGKSHNQKNTRADYTSMLLFGLRFTMVRSRSR